MRVTQVKEISGLRGLLRKDGHAKVMNEWLDEASRNHVNFRVDAVSGWDGVHFLIFYSYDVTE